MLGLLLLLLLLLLLSNILLTDLLYFIVSLLLDQRYIQEALLVHRLRSLLHAGSNLTGAPVGFSEGEGLLRGGFGLEVTGHTLGLRQAWGIIKGGTHGVGLQPVL